MKKKYLSDPKLATHIRVGVGIILHTDMKILLEKRTDCKKWGLIGGCVEIGEEVKNAAVRECFEETSIAINKKDLNFFNLYSDCLENRIIQYPDSCFHAIDLIYTYTVKETITIKKSFESIDIRFFCFNELPNDIVPPAAIPIRDFILSKA